MEGEYLTIPLDLKMRCVEMFESGLTARQVYNDVFAKEHEGMSFESFHRKLRAWRRKQYADDMTLGAGTYEGFTTHDATVQVGADGRITQAWIKQSAVDVDWDAIAEAVRAAAPVCPLSPAADAFDTGMLEIPLFDMHFGVAKFNDYADTLNEIAGIVLSRRWDEVNFIIGQDLIHNNDMRGHTAKGTQIEQVNIPKAWSDAQRFYFPLIESAICRANKVNIIYSKGNHDECISWCFVQMLKERYPAINVDDSLKARKCISWQGCFIGVCHGNGANSRNTDLRSQFTIEFPMEFASATAREVHAGHLHHEGEGDLYGVMVRRLSSGVPTDEWNDNEGYIGAHKRFQVFEYAPGKLRAIYYV